MYSWIFTVRKIYYLEGKEFETCSGEILFTDALNESLSLDSFPTSVNLKQKENDYRKVVSPKKN